MTNTIKHLHIPCPSCPSSDAYCVYEDGHGYCYSCKSYFKGDKKQEDVDYTYEYLPLRGLTKSTLEFYDIKTKIGPHGEPLAVGFVYPNGAIKTRDYNGKDFRWEFTQGQEPAKAGLFGRNKFAAGSHKSLTITEGEFDAASLWQVLKSPVVSVRSSSSVISDCTVDRAYINSFDSIYLAFDNDTAGEEAARAVARLFDPRKLYHVRFSNRKDANEYLEVGESQELRNIWQNSKRYLPKNIISSFSAFRDRLSKPVKWGVAYPFPTLTKMTYGIRTGESVLLLAPEKVGKTEIMHAIEHKLLRDTDDNIAAIFLEEPVERHLQALAGIELQAPVHLPDSGVGSDQVIRAAERSIKSDDRLHILDHFGGSDPDEFLDSIRFLAVGSNCKYILFDHISMAVQGGMGNDQRIQLEYLSTKLEQLVKELDFSLIMVSHVNDNGQSRGSHWLTKVADIVVSANRDLMNPSATVRHTVNLAVPYNRYCSASGPAGSYLFDPQKRTYTEVANDQTPANDNSPNSHERLVL